MMIYGIHPTVEALRAGAVTEIQVSSSRRRGLTGVLELAARARVRIRRVDAADLDRLANGGVHQGVVAMVVQRADRTVADLVREATVPLLVVLDGLEDPQNFGAIARAADGAGVDGIVIQTRRAATANAAAVKASAGALAHVRLAPVVNISRAIDELKATGVWAIGLDATADRSLYELDLTLPTALVVGAEGRGLRRLVRERCDWLASLPMRGRLLSLNASVATGIALFEAARQRSQRTQP